MVFSSIIFLLYFLPLFLLCYFFVGRKYKNFVILVFSIFFYSWGAPKFIFILLLTTLSNYYLVRWMDASQNKFHKKTFLVLSLCVSLGLLIYFKYYGFFIENLNVLLTEMGFGSVYWIKIALPIGISFFTFESITYVIDVYRKAHKPLDHFRDYLTYIILFPKLIAGPIVRYCDLADQILDRSDNENNENRLTGFYRFVIGLSKKVIIANHLGGYADSIFSMEYGGMNSAMAWAGILAYTFQIYFDFSGYSDMALGIGKMLGFRFPENFNSPYLSQGIAEFWRRWHITLGQWMKNYLYIPLGGNRVKSQYTLYFNLLLVFLASGLWHGASWTFIIWGLYHGAFIVMEKSFLLRFYQFAGSWITIPLTFLIVVTGWVFFRVENLPAALLYLNTMFVFNPGDVIPLGSEYYFYLSLAAFFSFITVTRFGRALQQEIFFEKYTWKRHVYMFAVSILLLLLSISMITSGDFNPFIYFRF